MNIQGFNIDIQGLMKDSLEKQQDKTKTVDIFQVLADSIQKEFVQSIFIKIIPKFLENCKTIPILISLSLKPALL